MRILLLLMVFISQTCFSQNKYREISVTGATGIANFIRFESEEEDNTYSSKLYFTAGVAYGESLFRKLFWETEILYSLYRVGQKSKIDKTVTNYNLHMLTIPLQLRYKLFKFFFVNAGILADLDLGSYNFGQSGFGASVGIGMKFKSKKIVYTINPYVQQHCISSFRNEDNPLRLRNAGVKFNVGYQF